MTPKIQCELVIAAKFFWRYAWRLWLLAIPVLAGVALLTRDAHRPQLLPSILALAGLILVCAFSVYLWTGTHVIRDVRCRSTLLTVTRSTTRSSPGWAVFGLWWGFAWRQQTFYAGLSFLEGVLEGLAGLHNLALSATLFFCTAICAGVLAMWALIFHPYGRTQVHIGDPGFENEPVMTAK